MSSISTLIHDFELVQHSQVTHTVHVYRLSIALKVRLILVQGLLGL